ncbi:MAG: hypothetical protein EA398_01965 [Deltaproteobacteria bacterium]|nr:MAG: hypothetical protein EA398_01965 [Deltaproteobacteria bacterium]
MRRDVIAHSGLEAFAEVGIIIFFAVFLAILARAVFMTKDEAETMLHMPLEDGVADEEVSP